MASFSDKMKDFSETANGRIVMVAVPVAVLAIVLVLVALSFLRSGGSSEIEQTTVKDTKTAPAPAKDSSTTAAEEPAEEIETHEATETTEAYVNEDFEIYETRDPFKEVDASATADMGSILGVSDPGSNPGTSTVSATGTVAPAPALSLDSIEQDDAGALYANTSYGSTAYIVREGERVGETSFQLSVLTADDATFLYGDDTLVLTVGQSVTK